MSKLAAPAKAINCHPVLAKYNPERCPNRTLSLRRRCRDRTHKSSYDCVPDFRNKRSHGRQQRSTASHTPWCPSSIKQRQPYHQLGEWGDCGWLSGCMEALPLEPTAPSAKSSRFFILTTSTTSGRSKTTLHNLHLQAEKDAFCGSPISPIRTPHWSPAEGLSVFGIWLNGPSRT